jgi:hypothetical protein
VVTAHTPVNMKDMTWYDKPRQAIRVTNQGPGTRALSRLRGTSQLFLIILSATEHTLGQLFTILWPPHRLSFSLPAHDNPHSITAEYYMNPEIPRQHLKQATPMPLPMFMSQSMPCNLLSWYSFIKWHVCCWITAMMFLTVGNSAVESSPGAL